MYHKAQKNASIFLKNVVILQKKFSKAYNSLKNACFFVKIMKKCENLEKLATMHSFLEDLHARKA